MLNQVLIPIVLLLIDVVTTVVIVQFVLYLLLTFNVVNMHNQFVGALWQSLNAILDPILNPIRKFMPNTGGIDFSPLVLIVLLRMFLIILAYLANPY